MLQRQPQFGMYELQSTGGNAGDHVKKYERRNRKIEHDTQEMSKTRVSERDVVLLGTVEMTWAHCAVRQVGAISKNPAGRSINNIPLNFIYDSSFLIFIIQLAAQIIDAYMPNKKMVMND